MTPSSWLCTPVRTKSGLTSSPLASVPPRGCPSSMTSAACRAELEPVGGVPVVDAGLRRRGVGRRLRRRGRRRSVPRPTTSTMATTSGNRVPPWKRTFLPLPFWARRAAFLVDDDEGATRAQCYRRPPHASAVGGRGDRRDRRVVDRALVRRGDGGRRGGGDDPLAAAVGPSPRRRPGRRRAAAMAAVNASASSGATATPAARRGEQRAGPRCRRRSRRRPAGRRRGSSTSSTAR